MSPHYLGIGEQHPEGIFQIAITTVADQDCSGHLGIRRNLHRQLIRVDMKFGMRQTEIQFCRLIFDNLNRTLRLRIISDSVDDDKMIIANDDFIE